MEWLCFYYHRDFSRKPLRPLGMILQRTQYIRSSRHIQGVKQSRRSIHENIDRMYVVIFGIKLDLDRVSSRETGEMTVDLDCGLHGRVEVGARMFSRRHMQDGCCSKSIYAGIIHQRDSASDPGPVGSSLQRKIPGRDFACQTNYIVTRNETGKHVVTAIISMRRPGKNIIDTGERSLGCDCLN